jgi:hypothetical protein
VGVVSWLVVVHGHEIGVWSMRAFPVRLPSGQRSWTVLDEDLSVVGEADAFLRHVRFGRDGSELTTRAYAGGIALFLRWCARSGRHWHAGCSAVVGVHEQVASELALGHPIGRHVRGPVRAVAERVEHRCAQIDKERAARAPYRRATRQLA